jgi:hypothetical protein
MMWRCVSELQRGAVGVTGARLSAGRAQQDGVAQSVCSALQQAQDAARAGQDCIANEEPPGDSDIEAKNNASRTVRVFCNNARIVVLFCGLLLELKPQRSERQYQFLSSPQLSMALPM